MTLHVTAPPATPTHSANALRSDIAQRLRMETRPDHDAIEANPRLARLLAADLTRAEYATSLGRLLGYYLPVEAALRDMAHVFPAALEADVRLSKTGLLRADLTALGASSDVPCADDAFLPMRQPEAAWGCLYVMEGSTLGGQIIARTLAASIDVHPTSGGSFHVPYGPLTGARWQTFRALLAREVEEHGLDPDAVVAGAKTTFATMNAWMAG